LALNQEGISKKSGRDSWSWSNIDFQFWNLDCGMTLVWVLLRVDQNAGKSKI
jgi:hypothetical protein